jgi:hypothetical protein
VVKLVGIAAGIGAAGGTLLMLGTMAAIATVAASGLAAALGMAGTILAGISDRRRRAKPVQLGLFVGRFSCGVEPGEGK